MTDTADLRERLADADSLEASRALIPRLEDELTAALARAEQAEARVDQLTDLLTLRTEALNRTGAHNDRLRTQIEAVRALLVHLHTDLVYAGDIRAILDTEGES